MTTPATRQQLIWKVRAIVRQYEAGAAPDLCMKRIIMAVKEADK